MLKVTLGSDSGDGNVGELRGVQMRGSHSYDVLRNVKLSNSLGACLAGTGVYSQGAGWRSGKEEETDEGVERCPAERDRGRGEALLVNSQCRLVLRSRAALQSALSR